MKYFVSYTTRDKEVTAGLLQTFSKELRKTGKVFIDMLDNNSADKQGRVISELDSSDILILIESESTYKSEWVGIELERAGLKKIPIRKVKIEELNILF
jgi:hypothetical protein